MSERIEKLVAELTLDEKAALVAGVDLWHGPGVDRLGIPALKVTDGPSGARGEHWSGRPSANFPCGTALGATWNPRARARGRRAPRWRGAAQAARTCCSRRPSTSTAIRSRAATSSATPKIRSSRRAWRSRTSPACSRQGVGCTVKHFVANDSEFERMTISSEVDERTLREISLVPFEAAVLEAGAWALMTAYNRVNGTYCSEHAELIAMLLRDEWGFDGLVMSDWYGTHSTVPAANAGLDLEMPGPAAVLRRQARRRRCARARSTRSDARRQGAPRAGADRAHRCASTTPTPRPRSAIDDPDRPRRSSRRAAGESFVLLQQRRRRAAARVDGTAVHRRSR